MASNSKPLSRAAVYVLYMLLGAALGAGIYAVTHRDSPLAQWLHLSPPAAPAETAVPAPIPEPTRPPAKPAISEPAYFADVTQPASKAECAQIFLEQGNGAIDASSESEIIKALGKPVRIEKKKIANIHEPSQADELRTLHFEGMTVTIYHVNSSEPKDILVGAEASSPKRPLLWGMRVGASRQQVIDLLGKPAKAEKNVLTYIAEDEPAVSTVTFKLAKDGKVTSVIWSYYID